jgi:hypothetical protein
MLDAIPTNVEEMLSNIQVGGHNCPQRPIDENALNAQLYDINICYIVI